MARGPVFTHTHVVLAAARAYEQDRYEQDWWRSVHGQCGPAFTLAKAQA